MLSEAIGQVLSESIGNTLVNVMVIFVGFLATIILATIIYGGFRNIIWK